MAYSLPVSINASPATPSAAAPDVTVAAAAARRSLRRRRASVGLGALGVVVLGLVVHVASSGPLGDFVADALYAVCLYLVLACAVPRMRPRHVAMTAWAACIAIELFQLTGVPAALSSIAPFRLLLGTTFSALDLVAYSMGVLLVLAFDHGARHVWLARQRHQGD